ncbi:MAG: PTS sugar transporter subunit IIA [Lachnospiraceae bacterium]
MKNKVQKFGKFLSEMVMPNIGALIAFGFLAAMIMGPLAGFCIKKFDQLMDGHMPVGFEMLINNFSAGIIGMLLAILGYVVVGPVMSGILTVLAAGVNILVSHSLLPLVTIFIEPAKVLFLNNAINHGIFTPLATAQATEAGKSIMYMLEPNPGPGLGVLLAYMFFCKDKKTKQSAPGAVIIHVLGGIHEIYFPYILMNPLVIIAPIVGNMATVFWFNLTDCGLVGPASPGSIIAYLMMTPGPDIWKVLVGVAIATGISFGIASPIVKIAGGKNSLEEAIQAVGELLHQLGYVDETYVDAMQEREKLITTYMGMGVAIPHGTSQAKGTVKKTGIVFLQYPQGVDFGDEKAQLVFGIAGIGEEHLNLLAKICEALEDEEVLERRISIPRFKCVEH